MKKKLFRYVVFSAGFFLLILLISNCNFFRETGVCIFYDATIGDFDCADEVTEKECDEMGGDFYLGEPCR